MNRRRNISSCLLVLVGCAGPNDDDLAYFPNVGVYEASPQQERVDRSFSDISIETPFLEVRPHLSEIRVDGCEEWGECEWRNIDGVRHSFFDDFLVVKRVDAAEFAERRIPALAIGSARERDEVLEAARRFVPEADFECTVSDEDNTESCHATLLPGWVTITFDASGSLSEVQLDGYHFT